MHDDKWQMTNAEESTSQVCLWFLFSFLFLESNGKIKWFKSTFQEELFVEYAHEWEIAVEFLGGFSKKLEFR